MESSPGHDFQARQAFPHTPCFPAAQAFQALPCSTIRYLLELVLGSFAAQHQGLPIFISSLLPSPTTNWAAKLIFSCQEPKIMSSTLYFPLRINPYDYIHQVHKSTLPVLVGRRWGACRYFCALVSCSVLTQTSLFSL